MVWCHGPHNTATGQVDDRLVTFREREDPINEMSFLAGFAQH